MGISLGAIDGIGIMATLNELGLQGARLRVQKNTHGISGEYPVHEIKGLLFMGM